jgi:glycosyltransferase involved in cell wall biosynthesis
MRFWNSIPSKKYFYQYEKVIKSFLPDSGHRERNVHKVQAATYAVQDEYDAADYEKTFGQKALWMPDMISAERIRRGQAHTPLSQRPIDLLFVGKIQGAWYWQRQEILRRIQAFGDAHHLKTEIVDTSYMRFNDVDIIEKNYYSQAKVVVNPIGTGNFFNIRFFETLAAGCICLQQADNNGLFLQNFRERYKEYNAVFFTTADLEQNISALFSDLSRYEKNVQHTLRLLMENDTGEIRFRALGIPCRQPDKHSVQADNARTKEKRARPLSGKKEYPKISIVTPSFNQGQFLEECIDSVLSQNYPNLEYVIMDGGSTDNSVEIIKKYEKHLVYWQNRPDNGQYFAIQEGFRKTNGEIMSWINSDDLLHPRALETVAAIFRNFPNVEWLMGRPNGIVQKTGEFWVMDFPVLWSRKNYLRRQYKNPYIQQEGTFWKRSLWEKAGGKIDTNLALAGDMELWARFFRYAQLYSVDALLGTFRTHSAQKTATSREAYHTEAEKIIDREIALYSQGKDKTLLPAPPPITAEQIAVLIGEAASSGSLPRAEQRPSFKVSAIVSTFNSERFIRGCLEDLVNQTLYQKGGLEIIVIDSSSEQNEKSVVEEFQKKYRSITYIRTTIRETVYAAWNRGIKASRGEYITNANTDDRHRKDALEVMAALLDQRPDIGLVYADVIITETENETFEKHTPASQFRWSAFDREKLSLGCFIGPQPMWRKSLHYRYGYFDETFTASGDWEFWLRIAEDTSFLHIPEFLGLYLRSPKSLEHKNAHRRIKEDRIIYRTYVPKYLPAYRDYFTEILATGIDYPVNIYRYGQVLAALEEYDDAISLYTAFLQKNPGYKGFNHLLEDLKNLKAGQRPPPQTRPDSLPEDVMACINRADEHIANNDLNSAREAIRQAIKYASGHAQLCSMLSDMLAAMDSEESGSRSFTENSRE